MKMKKQMIKRMASIFLALTVLLTTIPDIHTQAAENTIKRDRAKRYIVVMENRKATRAIEQEVSGDVLEENKSLAEKNMLVAELTEEEVKSLQREKDVLLVEEDFDIEADELDDSVHLEEESIFVEDEEAFYEGLLEYKNRTSVTPEDYEWNMKQVEANDISEELKPEKTSPIKVAVLDSGVDMVFGIELAGSVNLVPEEQYISPLFLDTSSHGTSIASIIAGNPQNEVQGVNPNTALYSIKVLDGDNRAPVSRVVEGIYWM